MAQTYNLYNLEAPFRIFLLAGNNSLVTVRNYLSDCRFFSNWLTITNKSTEVDLTLLDTKKINDYKNYLIDQQLPVKSVNRRLSSLRKFFTFCISQGWISENPAKNVPNTTVKSEELKMKSEFTDSNTAIKQCSNEILASYRSHLQQTKNPDINNLVETIGEFINS